MLGPLRGRQYIVIKLTICGSETWKREGSVSFIGMVNKIEMNYFGYVEKMNEERLVKRVFMSEACEKRGRERPYNWWDDEVKVMLVGIGEL